MQEFQAPAGIDLAPDARLSDIVHGHAAASPGAPALAKPDGSGGWRTVTAGAFATEVAELAAGFMAAGVGVGDRVGLLSRTRYEWTLVDCALWWVGAVTVPIYETSSSEQISWILADSGALGVVVESPAHAAAVAQVRDSAPELRHIWQIDAGDLNALTRSGAMLAAGDLEQRRLSVGAEDLATIIYTSGTTGRPKGCELTHRNLLAEAANATEEMRDVFAPGATTLLFLPLAHVFARAIEVACLYRGVELAHCLDARTDLLPDLASYQPTFLLAVPRVFEKIYNGARQKAQSESSMKMRIFDWAADTAIAYSQALAAGKVPWALERKHHLADSLVYGKIREATGGRVKYAVSGGAPLGARLGHFFRGIGVTILEGYGLTETTAGATLNMPDGLRVGSVGRPVRGTTVRIADDGEVLIHGDLVFRGYWHNATATAEVLGADGFFATGDLGRLDEDGFLSIVGRKKEILVTAGGKNVSPAVLEDRLRAHVLISQCLVVGDGRPFIAALVTLDAEALPGYCAANGLPALGVAEAAGDERIVAAIQQAVDQANAAVSTAESIRAFRILADDFTEDNGLLTPSLKVKRTQVTDRYSQDIEGLYRR